ncbi:MAG: (2Fe-2S)-binding protein [Cyanobacteria bacterium REEB65]|nr:(2Fe-2S)-binding protein [Cyanobacteria bacterium REEB65]
MADCCTTATKGAGALSRCPSCGQKGRSVGFETPSHLLRDSARARLMPQDAYSFCATATCDVVYFSRAGKIFHQADVSVPVTQKATSGPIPVCYCFGFFESDLEAELRQTGTETVTRRITEGIKAGLCACETKNPQGACCLGNVAVAAKRVRERLQDAGAPFDPGSPAPRELRAGR